MRTKEKEERTGDKVLIPGDYQFKAYYDGSRIQRFWHQTRLKAAQDALEIVHGDKLLDVGCGSGLLASFVASDPKVTVIATDANPLAIHFCKNQYHYPNLSFEKKRIDELDFETASFNKVSLLEVIEHVTSEQGATLLKEIHRILKPNGRLVLSTPNKKSAWPLIEFAIDKLKLAPSLAGDQHETLYSSNRLSQLAGTYGFKIVSKRTLLFMSPWMAAISWKLATRVHHFEMKYPLRCGSILLFCFEKPAT